MADKTYDVFLYLPVVRKVALDNMPLRNSASSQNFGEEHNCVQFFFSIMKIDQSVPIK